MPRLDRADKKPGLAPGFFLAIILASCGQVGEPPKAGSRPARLSIAGTIQDGDINEASGIAQSRRAQDLLWLHEDSGAKARLYAVDTKGRSRGRIRLEKADNKDWEDIAAFEFDGTPYLLVADIGDNDAKRKSVKLYLVEEPNLDIDHKVEVAAHREIKFRYADGPRDAEALAVDGERALILTKRDLPPRLYSVPLYSELDEPIEAELLGSVTTLPRPNRQDAEFAPMTGDWPWQPTAMDIASDGSAIAILTYSAVYYYANDNADDWLATLQRPPLRFDLRNVRDAEAIAFGADGQTLYVTVEKKHAPILRIDMLSEPQ